MTALLEGQRFDTEPIAVVGCGKAKLAHRARARELYVGNLFRARLALAEALGARVIYIASARHGLVPDTAILDPYEADLRRGGQLARESWTQRITDTLHVVLHASPGPVLALVSGPYADWVPHIAQAYTVGRGLPQGKLLHALRAYTEALEP